MKLLKTLLLVVVITLQQKLYAQEFIANNEDGVPIHYSIISTTDRTVAVCGGKKAYKKLKLETLSIPEEVNYNGITYTVTEISKNAFGSWNGGLSWGRLSQVKFPSTLKMIGDAAFCGNPIKEIKLPEGLHKIGKYAFFDNLAVESIFIPSSVKIMDSRVFGHPGALGTVKLAKNVNIENLPLYVTKDNCQYYGLTVSDVERYYAYHIVTPTTNNDANNYRLENTISSRSSRQDTAPEIISQPNVPSSDVDTDIPIVSVDNENTFAIIFANENYHEEENVEYALNDGEMFKEYCHKVLGLPKDNVHIRKDATLNNIKAEVSWMQQVAKVYKGQAKFIVFYAGHGIPDEKSATAYLLPVDGKGTMLDTGYSLAKLYEQLGNMPAERVTVFMDACFSGSKRGEGMLISARGVAIKAKTEAPQGKMVVFSAASGDETAYPLKEKEHGLFTYYLLKKLKETKGDVTYGELGSYITEQVSRKSIVSNGKSQSPTVTPSQNVAGTWKTMKLK